jgi:hypothetical protein
MMIDPEDKRTHQLELREAPENAQKNNVVSIAEPRLEERAIELGLVRERRPVFVFDAGEAKKRGGSAERMAKMRAKQSEAGLRPAPVPAAILDAVKAVGGWEKWQAQIANAAIPPAPKPIEKIVEVPGPPGPPVPGPERLVQAKISGRDLEFLSLGKAVQQLTGWRRTLANFALGGAVTRLK